MTALYGNLLLENNKLYDTRYTVRQLIMEFEGDIKTWSIPGTLSITETKGSETTITIFDTDTCEKVWTA